MLALYRGGPPGRRAGSYQSARRTLVDELGIEPGSGAPGAGEGDPAARCVARPRSPRRPRLARSSSRASTQQRSTRCWRLQSRLAQKPAREIIVSCLVTDRDELAAASAEVARLCDGIGGRGGVAPGRRSSRATSPGADTSRLATEQDVDLVLVAASPALLDDPELTSCLRTAPCDVAVLVGSSPAPGPVLVPFAGAEHDWSGDRARGMARRQLAATAAARRPGRRRRAGREPAAGERVARGAACPRRGGASRCSSSPAPDALAAAARECRGRRRRPVRPLAQGGPRPGPQRARRERSADAARAQGSPAGRFRAAGEPHALHVVAQGRLISGGAG